MITPAPTEAKQLDEAVERVKRGSRAFARLSIDDRIRLVEDLRDGYHRIAEESVLAACAAKGIDPHSPLAGEEWLGGPMVTLRVLRLTSESLRQIKRFGAPKLDRAGMRTLPDGRLAVKVFPGNALDATLLPKHLAEAYMLPGVNAENIAEHQARFYRKPHEGRVCAVLGAGNVNAIPPTDCLYKMFVDGSACVLKTNPVNAYLGPLLERAFRKAIDRDFFAVVYGGAEVGGALVNHALVDEVHITGSDKTHDAIVWGTGPEAEARKARNEPLLKKNITSELGNITPVLVVPGPWADDELEHQAHDVAGMVANNAAFNCNAARVLVTPRSDERRRILEGLNRGLAKATPRKAYYPGAEERWKAFTESRPGLQLIGTAGPGELPWAIISGVDPAMANDLMFRQEPWCAVLGETTLAATDPAGFLDEAVKFVNEKLWGTLAVTLLVHPKTMKDPVLGQAVEKAIGELRYGAVCVNTWAGAAFGLGQTPWGAHPSSSLADIQSGRGFVHNTLMLEDVEKCVLRGPVKGFPISPWFPGHRTADVLGRKLCEFEMDPSWLKVPGIAAAAMRG